MSRSLPALLPRLLRIGLWTAVVLADPHSLTAAFWKPVAPDDLTLARPRVDAEAGVEILLRETTIDDSADETTRYHTYVRLKVYDARGVAALDKIEIVETRDAPVINVAARVIRPDGSVVEVDRGAVHARELLRHAAVRVKAKAFSPPALVPGCIVEYQWEEESEHSIAGLQLYFQDRFPAARVRFRIKPFNYNDRGLQLFPAGFRYRIPELRTDSQGFYLFEHTNVPALREEPWMPPDDMAQSWMVLYSLRRGQKADEFWKDTGRALAQETSRLTLPTGELSAHAQSLIGDATDDREKLRRLAVFCRDGIDNRSTSQSRLQFDGRERSAQKHQPASDTLENRRGSAADINLLFIALARAAGFEARLACVTDRSKRLFREPLPARFMLPDSIAAVRVDGVWAFHDPGSRFVPIGRLPWKNEGVTALLCDRVRSEFVRTPRTPRAASGVARTARLSLDEQGTATGVVALVYRGHAATAEREIADLGPEQQASRIYETESARWPGCELAGVAVQHGSEPDEPLRVTYGVRVPDFAAIAGARLVFPLAYFQHGVPPVFTATKRQHAVYLQFESVEEDIVELALPAGFALEESPAPRAFALPPALEYRASLVGSAEEGRLIFRRQLSRGGMLFPASTYRLLRQANMELFRRDGQVAFAVRKENM